MPASAAADAALVPLPQDSLVEDLNNLSHLTSLQSFLDEDEPMVAASPGEDTLVSTSTMPFVVVPQSVAGGNSIASSSESHLVPRDLAVQALEYQRSLFANVANEYKRNAEDVCQAEVAQSTASVEAAAWSHLNAQRAELNNAQQFVTSLRGSLNSAEQLAINESSQNRSIREQAVAEFASLRETSEHNEKQTSDA